MKKIILILVCFLLFTCSVFADGVTIVDTSTAQKDVNLEISGEITEKVADRWVTLRLLYPNKQLSDLDSGFDGVLCDMQQTITKSEGKFSFPNVVMPKAAVSGEYKIVIDSFGDIINTSYYYLNDEDARLLITAINNASEGGIKAAVLNFCAGSNFSFELYNPDFSEIFQIFYNMTAAGGLQSAQEVSGKLKTASVLAAVKRAGTTAAIKELIDDYDLYLNTKSADKYDVLENLSAGMKLEVYDKLNDRLYLNEADYVNFFNQSVVMTQINNIGNYIDLNPLISNNITLLRIDTAKYKSSMDSELSSNIPYANADALNAKIAEISGRVIGGGGGSPSTGGGGGSSGGSGSGGSLITRQVRDETPVWNGFSDMDNALWAVESVNKLVSKGVISQDVRYRPDDKVTRAEFTKLLVEAFGLKNQNARASFSDVLETDWFYNYVASAYENGIAKGRDDGSFGSFDNITRQDMAALIYRVIKYKNLSLNMSSAAVEFTDKELISDYAYEGVSDMQRAGIINGVGDGRFNPLGFATRAEAAKIIYSAVGEG